jgi:hypothetical protein
MLGLMKLRGIISVSSMILQLRTDVSCWVVDWIVCVCICLSARIPARIIPVSTPIITITSIPPAASHSPASHFIIQSPAAGIASPWKLPHGQIGPAFPKHT